MEDKDKLKHHINNLIKSLQYKQSDFFNKNGVYNQNYLIKIDICRRILDELDKEQIDTLRVDMLLCMISRPIKQ